MPATPGSPNGTDRDDPLDLGDLLPATRSVSLIRDGQQVHFEAFVYRTAPVSVYGLIAQAHDEYTRVAEDDGVGHVHRDQALCRYYGAIARALTPGMTIDEADRLGGDFPKLERYLKALGYPPPREDADAGEAPAAESTTEPSSPSSAASTAATTGTG